MKNSERDGFSKMLWSGMTLIFLSVLFLSLFHIPVGFDHSNTTSDCPFMSHDEVLCGMSPLDHLLAWESAFASTVPTFGLSLLVLTVIILFAAIAPHRLRPRRYREPTLPRHTRDRVYSFTYRPLQELFSSGILHPKLFS